ncbi:DUF424 domain-containing protein [Candidatus Woesearchaeota archaeon]|nr:DUF424 domain-containing protein [Candidatus Woesearchaeota archaeon]
MIAKVHKAQDQRIILAICDSDLAGKKIEEGKLQLDLSSGFYKGAETSEEKVVMLTKNAYIVNAAGKKSVGLLLDKKIADKKSVMFVKGVPHVQAVLE